MSGIRIPSYIAKRMLLTIGSGTALKMLLALVSMRQPDFLSVPCTLGQLADVCGVTPLTADHNLDALARAFYTEFGHDEPVFTECSMLLTGGSKRKVEIVFTQNFVDILRCIDGHITIPESEFYEYRMRSALMMRLRLTPMLGNKTRMACHFINDNMHWLIGYKSPNMSHACQVGILPGVEEINTVCHAFTVDVKDRRRGSAANARIGRLDFDVRKLVSHFERRRCVA